MDNTLVIHVNENDEILGYIPKLEAHRLGLLHRAISVFLFNEEGKWLLQKRAEGKYHSPGLWSNTCCSHPLPEEDTSEASVRRLKEEMNMTETLEKAFVFTYHAKMENSLIEHEVDHVYTGFTNSQPIPNPDEVCDWRYVSTNELEKEIAEKPEEFSVWFKMLFPEVKSYIKKKNVA